ncbi:unnamed protein product [Pleuronectes platessa]|uniref:Uncharacterized protein n=1 Tax=Pleuronectes platessa TaxID=8262 RepID=A0A9N7UEH9_PLEPL|nr:unnamed protein product [Pleuronectes platessa]
MDICLGTVPVRTNPSRCALWMNTGAPLASFQTRTLFELGVQSSQVTQQTFKPCPRLLAPSSPPPRCVNPEPKQKLESAAGGQTEMQVISLQSAADPLSFAFIIRVPED